MKKLAIRGTIWTIVGYGSSQVLRFGNNLILTRLLQPEFFGLMALVNTLIIGLNLFSDIGVGTSIIQNQRGNEPNFLNTAWTIQVIRGFSLFLCSLILAIPIANYYEEPRLNLLIPVVGLNTIISGFNSTNLFTLTKKVALAKLVKVDLITQIIGLLVMIIGSWLTHSIWALVAGGLVGTSLKMLISHRLIPGFSNHFAWDKQALEEILRFGKWIFVSTAMAFLASQSDRLVLGKLLSFSMLGVYTIAYTFADLPRQVIKKIGMQVIFPLVSKQIEIPRPNLKAKIAPKRKLMLLGCAILLALSVSFGDLLIIALYDERYISATWMMPILSLGVWPYLLFITINPILLSFGRSVYPAIGNFTSFLIIAFGVPLVFSFTGTLGAIIVIALSDFPVYGIISYGAWQEKILFLKDDIQLTMMFIGLIIILCFLRFLINSDTSIQQLFV